MITPQVTTFFLLCLFMVIPFISFGIKQPFVSIQANPTEIKYPLQYSETPCILPTTRKLLQQQQQPENQSPWPKHQFQANYSQTIIITMEDVYLDEQQAQKNHSSVLLVKSEYLYTPKSM